MGEEVNTLRADRPPACMAKMGMEGTKKVFNMNKVKDDQKERPSARVTKRKG